LLQAKSEGAVVLSAATIKDYVKNGLISIRPRFDERQLRPFGLRVHLAAEILVPEPGQRVEIDTSREQLKFRTADIKVEGFSLKPGSFVLGSTIECLKITPELACRLDGRSTLARLGLLVHCTAEMIDSIHSDFRSVVVELANVGPFEIGLHYGCAVGMVVFETVSGFADPHYEQSQYKGQTAVASPNLLFDIPGYDDDDQ
jgi:dCTP deaminase